MNLARAQTKLGNTVRQRISRIDWHRIVEDLDARGFAVIGELLTARDCRTIASFYPDDANFRSRVVMARHGFGRGEYKYFSYPLPSLIEDLRTELYPWLANVANRWNEAMRIDERYPNDHAAYLKHCIAAGQTRPTPLLLQYGPGDFNCLHQDLYGERVFPLQVAVLLSLPGRISRAVNLFSRSNGRACSQGFPSFRCARATPSCFPSIIARCGVSAVIIGLPCVMA
jgi:hypothetical protein